MRQAVDKAAWIFTQRLDQTLDAGRAALTNGSRIRDLRLPRFHD